jgi:hypothetical protein
METPQPAHQGRDAEAALPDGARGFRIAAPAQAEMVEVSVNEGPWLPCRRVGGFWVSDWSGFELGKYQLRARMRTTKSGKSCTTLLHRQPDSLPTGD